MAGVDFALCQLEIFVLPAVIPKEGFWSLGVANTHQGSFLSREHMLFNLNYGNLPFCGLLCKDEIEIYRTIHRVIHIIHF